MVQLQRLDMENARRAQIVDRYRSALADVPGITLPGRSPDRQSSNHLCCVLAEQRDALVMKLKNAGIETGVHYRRNDLYPMYTQDPALTGTEHYWRKTLSLPLHLSLTDEQVDHIITQIRQGW